MRQQYLQNVVTLKFYEGKCIGCGMCVAVCPHEVFFMNHQKARMVAKDCCMECGACARNCPVAAIEVNQGVGCAYAIMNGMFTGGELNCGCSDDDNGCC